MRRAVSGRRVLVFLSCLVLATAGSSAVGQTGEIPLPQAGRTPPNAVPMALIRQAAATRANAVWGRSWSLGPVVPLVDIDGVTTAYAFHYRLDGAGFPSYERAASDIRAERELRRRDTGELLPSARPLDLGDAPRPLLPSTPLLKPRSAYGWMIVSARYDYYPILSYGEGLSEYYTMAGRGQAALAARHPGDPPRLRKLYYVFPFISYFGFEAPEGEALVDAHLVGRASDRTITLSSLRAKRDTADQEVMRRLNVAGLDVKDAQTRVEEDTRREWRKLLAGGPLSTSSNTWIPEPEKMPQYDWHKGCSPTSGAMVLGYWDNYREFGRLVLSHYEDFDEIEHDWDYNIPHPTLERLREAMETDDDGETNPWNISIGLREVAEEAGYGFGITDVIGDCFDGWEWDTVRSEINAGHPFVWSVSWWSHSMACLGYNEENKDLIVQDTWNPGQYYVHRCANWSSFTEISSPYPVTGESYSANLFVPNGDMGYNCGEYAPGHHDSHGEHWYTGSRQHIWWGNHGVPAPGGVRISLSTNGGLSFTVPVAWTEDDCDYEWLVPPFPADVTNARIRVSQLVGTEAVSEDGSWGDFVIVVDTEPPNTLILSYPPVTGANATIVCTAVDNASSLQDCQYSYRLNGLDWSSWSSQESAHLVGLATGEYTFEVRAMDASGNIDPTPANCTWTVGPGWPSATFGAVASSPALGDLEGDGDLELVVGSEDSRVYAWHHDGNQVFAVLLPDTGGPVTSSPALADLDGDGDLEMIVGSWDQSVYAWHHDGTPVDGWPRLTWGQVFSSPAVGDLDGDGDLEVVVGSGPSDHTVYAWHHNGDPVAGWPKTTSLAETAYVSSAPALSDLDGDGRLEVVAGCCDGKVYAWNDDGTTLAGLWPVSAGGPVKGSPAIGDLDGDGHLEVVVGSDDGDVYAWHYDGTPVGGLWPVSTGGAVQSSPALGDLDGEGHLEVIVGSDDGSVHAWDYSGGELEPFWPVATGSAVRSSPALGDLDGDGDLEIVVGCDDGQVYALDHYGMPVTNWPQTTSGPVVGSPALADLDADGYLEVVVGSTDDCVYVWSCEETTGDRLAWPMFRHDTSRRGMHSGTYDFTADLTSGYAPLTVQFTNQCSQATDCLCWDFGDGTHSGPSDSSEQSLTHVYLTPGHYTVTLSIAGWDAVTKVDYITVLAPPPVAEFVGGPTSGPAPLTVAFTDESTGSPHHWVWNFGDGFLSHEQNPVHEYAAPGRYSVLLAVVNTAGFDTEVKLDYITVAGAPVARFEGDPIAGMVPLTVSFADLSDGSPTSWAWDFGDGATSTAQNPIHEYAEVRTYPVSLTVTNQNGSDTEAIAHYIGVTWRDVPLDDWAITYMLACADAGIVKGYEDGTYRPKEPVDRGQMAVYISRGLVAPSGDAAIPSGPATATFPEDVPTDHWAYKWVEYAVANHIVGGYEDGTYRPAVPVTRDQMAVFIARGLVAPNGDAAVPSGPAIPTFLDVPTDHWAYRWVEFVASQGVAQGYSDGTYRPDWVVDRAQMAVYMQRAFALPM